MVSMRYSIDLRQRVVAALNEGQTMQQVADRFKINKCTVLQYKKRAATGSLEPRKPGPKNPAKLTEQDHQTIRKLIDEKPGITLKELVKHMSVPVAICTMSRTLDRLGISLKKRRTSPANNNALMSRKNV